MAWVNGFYVIPIRFEQAYGVYSLLKVSLHYGMFRSVEHSGGIFAGFVGGGFSHHAWQVEQSHQQPLHQGAQSHVCHDSIIHEYRPESVLILSVAERWIDECWVNPKGIAHSNELVDSQHVVKIKSKQLLLNPGGVASDVVLENTGTERASLCDVVGEFLKGKLSSVMGDSIAYPPYVLAGRFGCARCFVEHNLNGHRWTIRWVSSKVIRRWRAHLSSQYLQIQSPGKCSPGTMLWSKFKIV
jgi:hypothetical protein